MTLHVKWLDRGREPQINFNRRYPSGKDVGDRFAAPACFIELPYPAQRCGLFIVTCDTCGKSVGVTTAGRVDDPRSLTMACKQFRQEAGIKGPTQNPKPEEKQ